MLKMIYNWENILINKALRTWNMDGREQARRHGEIFKEKLSWCGHTVL